MPKKPIYVKEWTEDYRGWRLKFKIRARGEDGYLKTGVYVSETKFFGLLSGMTQYKEVADDWTIGKENLEEQEEQLREGAHEFIDNIETGREL